MARPRPERPIAGGMPTSRRDAEVWSAGVTRQKRVTHEVDKPVDKSRDRIAEEVKSVSAKPDSANPRDAGTMKEELGYSALAVNS